MVALIERKKGFTFVKAFYEDVHDRPCSHIEYVSLRKQQTDGSFTESIGHTVLVDLTKNEEELWKGLRHKFCQEQIRKAERFGIAVHQGSSEQFYALYEEFMQEKGFAHPLQKEVLASHGEFWLATKGEDALSGAALFTEGSEYIRLWVLPSARFSSAFTREQIGWSTRLLLWRCMLDAKKRGFHAFDMGGIAMDERDPRHGITEFKKAFGGQVVAEYHYTKTYSTLLKLKKMIL